MPYKGSKNAIAEWVVDNLPKADYFVDLFCGGCAVTHRALLSGKYKRFIINDIDGRLPKLFLEAAHGKHRITDHPEWVSREEFHRRKDEDAYIALIWSFGNDGKGYIYGADIENFKHAYHIAVFEDRPELLKPYGYNITSTHKTGVYERYLEFNRQIKAVRRNDMECLERAQEIESLQRLQSLQSLQSLHGDYAEVKIPEGAVIYCDPPYRGTNCGKYAGFDSERFYEWARRQDNIYISEYSMPDDFVVVAEREKVVLSASNGNSLKATERIYTNRRTYERMGADGKRAVMLGSAVQLSLF